MGLVVGRCGGGMRGGVDPYRVLGRPSGLCMSSSTSLKERTWDLAQKVEPLSGTQVGITGFITNLKTRLHLKELYEVPAGHVIPLRQTVDKPLRAGFSSLQCLAPKTNSFDLVETALGD